MRCYICIHPMRLLTFTACANTRCRDHWAACTGSHNTVKKKFRMLVFNKKGVDQAGLYPNFDKGCGDHLTASELLWIVAVPRRD